MEAKVLWPQPQPVFSGRAAALGVGLAAEDGQDGRAGRGQQFVLDVAAAAGEPLDQAQHRRRRHRQHAVPGVDAAAPGDQDGEIDGAAIQLFPQPAEAQDVDQRIVGADLVQVDVLQLVAVDRGFGREYGLENAAGAP